MWSNIFIFFGVSVVTALIMYLDSRLFDKPKTRMTYIKTIVMTNVITFAVIYTLTWLSPTKNIKDIVHRGGELTKKIIEGNTTMIDQIGEEMLAGDAPF
jgi:hypothetical protein